MHVLYPHTAANIRGRRGDDTTEDEFAGVPLSPEIKAGVSNMRTPAFALSFDINN
ncbi:MAG: hypothetical protein GX969_08325 [Firmicutes bacterium]|nr:hypothetical protein [Bacillota bacterium]